MTTRIAALITIAVVLVAAPASGQAAAPTLAEARKAMTAAHDAAVKLKVNLSCVIVDSRGDLVAAERMDRARFFTVAIATGKARASAMFGQPSANLANIGAMRLDQAIDGPQMLFIQGAVPITRTGQAFGAMGCSGGSGQQDEDAAKAGVSAMQ